MIENIDVSIGKKEVELQPLLLHMERCKLQFINDTTQFARAWFVKEALEYAMKKPEITLQLDKEQLAKMKEQVNNLANNADKIVTNSLLDPELWWHRTPHVNADAAAYEQLGNDTVGNKFPEVLDKAVRRALGELGTILEQFGYGVTTSALNVSYAEFWFERNQETGGIHPFFPHLLEWSQEMQNTVMKYDVVYKKGLAVFKEIMLLKDEKKRQEAAALWNSI